MDQTGLSAGDLDDVCVYCDGQGMRVVEDERGRRTAVPCVCRAQRRSRRVLRVARIPRRYEHCTLDSFEPNYAKEFGEKANTSLARALQGAKKFVEGYPMLNDGAGLLLTGTIGTGKTHLSVGVLQALVEQRGATGLFYDYRELLKQVQNSYNPRVEATELQVLAPVFDAEVLVLDELGASKPTEWVWDTVAHILNTRYNDKRSTIITSNYPNLPPRGLQSEDPRNSSGEETLGDRIGERMRSRLQEMCYVMNVTGEDYRLREKRAIFF